MRIRTSVFTVVLIFLGSNFLPVFSQENPESRINWLIDNINSLPNLPKLERVNIRIDTDIKITIDGDRPDAYYTRWQKRFFRYHNLNPPEIHISKSYILKSSDSAITYVLAHELGHHFDHRIKIYIETNRSIDSLIEGYKERDDDQYFADAFALYILGPDLYKKGKEDDYLSYQNKGIYSLYVKTNLILQQYEFDRMESWVNYSLNGAKSKLDIIEKLVQAQRPSK